MVIVDINDPEFSSRADKLKFLAKFQTFVNKFSPFIQNILTSNFGIICQGMTKMF